MNIHTNKDNSSSPFNNMAEDRLPQEFIEDSGLGTAAPQPPDSVDNKNSLNEILIHARHVQASDVHLSVNNAICYRQFGTLKTQSFDNLTSEIIQEKIQAILTPKQRQELSERGDLEYVYTIPGAGRYRVTIMKQRLGWDFTARVIPLNIPRFADSGMPASCAKLTQWAQGLILITGPAGCGKTTSLSILVEMLNQSRHEHIITIENPIEIVYTPKNCQITQREVGRHTLSQANALRASLREDPDIIVVSELRDYETIQLAISAAETGHLVFGTMNTNNACQTIFSLINSFPADEQSVIANMVSESLRGVISQQLVPKIDGTGVVPAFEVLLQNSAISNMIREGKMQQVNNSISMGKAAGMVLLDNSLNELIQKGEIDGKEAYCRAINPNSFKQYLEN